MCVRRPSASSRSSKRASRTAPGAVDAIEMRKVDFDRAAPSKRGAASSMAFATAVA